MQSAGTLWYKKDMATILIGTSYVTKNSEYHVVNGACVAVYTNKGVRLNHHRAVGKRLVCAARIMDSGAFIPTSDAPVPGNSLIFDADGAQIITSPLTAVERNC